MPFLWYKTSCSNWCLAAIIERAIVQSYLTNRKFQLPGERWCVLVHVKLTLQEGSCRLVWSRRSAALPRSGRSGEEAAPAPDKPRGNDRGQSAGTHVTSRQHHHHTGREGCWAGITLTVCSRYNSGAGLLLFYFYYFISDAVPLKSDRWCYTDATFLSTRGWKRTNWT